MANPEEPSEYSVSNYGAVDRQIDEMRKREEERTRGLRYANYLTLAKIMGIVLIAIGILLLLAGWGYQMARSYEAKEIHHTITETRPAEIAQPTTLPSETTFDPETKSLIEQGKISVKKDITYFVTRETKYTNYPEVITGIIYKKSSDEKPIRRYCYIHRPQPDGTSQRINLGVQNEGASPKQYGRPSNNDISASVFRELYALCAWSSNAENLDP